MKTGDGQGPVPMKGESVLLPGSPMPAARLFAATGGRANVGRSGLIFRRTTDGLHGVWPTYSVRRAGVP